MKIIDAYSIEELSEILERDPPDLSPDGVYKETILEKYNEIHEQLLRINNNYQMANIISFYEKLKKKWRKLLPRQSKTLNYLIYYLAARLTLAYEEQIISLNSNKLAEQLSKGVFKVVRKWFENNKKEIKACIKNRNIMIGDIYYNSLVLCIVNDVTGNSCRSYGVKITVLNKLKKINNEDESKWKQREIFSMPGIRDNVATDYIINSEETYYSNKSKAHGYYLFRISTENETQNSAQLTNRDNAVDPRRLKLLLTQEGKDILDKKKIAISN